MSDLCTYDFIFTSICVSLHVSQGIRESWCLCDCRVRGIQFGKQSFTDAEQSISPKS